MLRYPVYANMVDLTWGTIAMVRDRTIIYIEAENGLPDVEAGTETVSVIMIGSCRGPICI